MNTKTHNKNRILPKTAISLTALLLASLMLNLIPGLLLAAEDYPSGFLGPGYREYLNGKIVDGYYVDAFAKLDTRLQTRVEKRNQIEDILNTSYKATPETNYGILKNSYEIQKKNEDLTEDIAKARRERESSAAGSGNFYYTTFEDGRTEYYRDGLVMRIENEPVYDEFGNESRKNTYNIKYNDRRLMVSYDATVTNAYGDVTKIRFEGAEYTDDSVFYGTNGTNANRLFTKYRLTEIDAAGNVTVTEWKADGYEGKCLQGFVEERYSDIYGYSYAHRYNIVYETGDPDMATSYEEEGYKYGDLPGATDGQYYHLLRTNITYESMGEDSPLLTGYHEVYTDEYGNKTTSDVALTYKIVDGRGILLETTSDITYQDIQQGTLKTELTRIVYQYDEKTGELTAAKGYINGTQEDLYGVDKKTITGEDEYTIFHGTAKLVRSYRETSIPGASTQPTVNEITYTYDELYTRLVDAAGQTVGVDLSTSGATTVFYSIEKYDIIKGQAKLISTESKSYEFGLFNDSEPVETDGVDFEDMNNSSLIEGFLENCDAYTTSTKTYEYDSTGRLIAADGESIKTGRTESGDQYTTHIDETYRIENGALLLDTQDIITTGTNILTAQTWTQVEKLQYSYGEASANGRTAKLALLGANDLEVTLNGVTYEGSIKETIDAITGEVKITKTENHYEAAFGQIILPLIISVTTGTDIEGNYTQTTATTTNTYGWVTFNGQNKYTVVSSTVSTVSEGYGINGGSWSSTPETYTLDYQKCTYNGREYWGAQEGTVINTEYTISGTDLFGDDYTQTISNTYEVKFGNPMLQSSVSVYENTDLSGNYTKTTTVKNYTYGWVEFEGQKYYTATGEKVEISSEGSDIAGNTWETTTPETYNLKYEVCEKDGVKYWGLPEGMKFTTTSVISGTDVYGNTYTENRTNSYVIKFGKPFVTESVSVRETNYEDGSYNKTTSTTTYEYGAITFQGQEYYGMLSYSVSTVSEGHDEDNKKYSSTPETYTLTYKECEYNGVKYWGLEEGATFTTTHTQTNDGDKSTITNSYVIKFGKPWLAESTTKGEGFSQNVINNYGWFTFQGQEYYGLVSQDFKFRIKGYQKTFTDKFHLDYAAQEYNGATYWGLEEGLTFKRTHRESGHKSGSTVVYKDANWTIVDNWSYDWSFTLKITYKVKYGSFGIDDINSDFNISNERHNVVSYGHFTVTDSAGAVHTINVVYSGIPGQGGVMVSASQTIKNVTGIPDGVVIHINTDFAGGTVTISILNSDNAEIFNQTLNLEYENITIGSGSEAQTLTIPKSLNITAISGGAINEADINIQLYWGTFSIPIEGSEEYNTITGWKILELTQ